MATFNYGITSAHYHKSVGIFPDTPEKEIDL